MKNYVHTNTKKSNFGSGIEEEMVENSDEFQDLVKSFVCVICLDIVKQPVQCTKCESLYCGECWDILKTSGKNCVYNCPNTCIGEANKFVIELLKCLSLKCNICNKKGIDYLTFIKHVEGCSINVRFSNIDELNKEIKERDRKIESLEKELDDLKIQQQKKVKESEELKVSQQQTKATSTEMVKLRNMLITHNLSNSQKMELYKATIEGRLHDFMNLVKKGYNVLEEVSAVNYYWTPFHYAMHYGKIDIILFILEVLFKSNSINYAVLLESNDGRCPILCLLRSNSLDLKTKAEYIDGILKKYSSLKISSSAKAEMKKRGLDELINKYKL
jgi:hypothetical protein